MSPPGRAPRGLGGELVAGRHAVRELLATERRRVRDVWMAEGTDPAEILRDIEALAAELRVPVRRVSRTRLDAEAGTEAPQGVLAHAAPLPEADLDTLARPADHTPFLVVLDGITDPHNLGALLRTAEVAGATGAVVARHRAAHVTPTVAKAAAGAIEHLPIAVAPGIPTALARLQDLGVWTVGLDGEAEESIFDVAVVTEPLALVLGAEGHGLGRLTRERCEVLAAIPRAGFIESLNVAAAGAVACFEVARRRGRFAPFGT